MLYINTSRVRTNTPASGKNPLPLGCSCFFSGGSRASKQGVQRFRLVEPDEVHSLGKWSLGPAMKALSPQLDFRCLNHDIGPFFFGGTPQSGGFSFGFSSKPSKKGSLKQRHTQLVQIKVLLCQPRACSSPEKLLDAFEDMSQNLSWVGAYWVCLSGVLLFAWFQRKTTRTTANVFVWVGGGHQKESRHFGLSPIKRHPACRL